LIQTVSVLVVSVTDINYVTYRVQLHGACIFCLRFYV